MILMYVLGLLPDFISRVKFITWGVFHLHGETGCSDEKSNGTDLSTGNFSEKEEHVRSEIFLFSLFCRNDRKVLYHLLRPTSAMLLDAVFALET